MSAALRDARRDRGLNLEDVSAAVGVTASALSQYERGVTVPRAATARRIADFFGVRQSEFWPTKPRDPEQKAA